MGTKLQKSETMFRILLLKQWNIAIKLVREQTNLPRARHLTERKNIWGMMSGFIPLFVHLAHVRFSQLDNTPSDFKHLSSNYQRSSFRESFFFLWRHRSKVNRALLPTMMPGPFYLIKRSRYHFRLTLSSSEVYRGSSYCSRQKSSGMQLWPYRQIGQASEYNFSLAK